MPGVRTGVPGVFCAADWVAQGPGDALGGAKGLSQEKALAAGLEAGNLVRVCPELCPHKVARAAKRHRPWP